MTATIDRSPSLIARRRFGWLGVILLVGSMCLFWVPGRALATSALCYWGDSSCNYGYMYQYTPSPWTGNYVVDANSMYILPNDSASYLTLQIRPYTGASGYSWTSPAQQKSFIQFFNSQNVQSRCFDSGGGYRWTECAAQLYP